jgi:hypothetical protein
VVHLPIKCEACGKERYNYGRCQCQSKPAHELVPFLAMWATQYQRDYKLDGLHPVHFDLMQKYGARMADFKRATNAEMIKTIT